MGLTQMQQLAVDMRGRPILVAAAAGSGKTSVLSKRVISLLAGDCNLPPIDADRMLIVTFTKAASAELRERITKELEKRIVETPENEKLQHQRRLLAQAQISTIDSLCKTILQQNFEKLGLPPQFSIIQGGALRQMQDEVLEELMVDCYEKQTPGFAAVRALCENGSDSKIKQIILAVYTTARAEPNLALWLQSCTIKMKQAMRQSQHEESLFVAKMQQTAAALVQSLQNLEDLAQAEEEILFQTKKRMTETTKAKNQLTIARYAEWEKVMRGCMTELENTESVAEMEQALANLPKKPTKKDYKELREQERLAPWMTLWEQANQLADWLSEFHGSNAAHDKLVLDAVQEIYSMTAEFHQRLSLRKTEKGQLDFADLEQYTVQLLAQAAIDDAGEISFTPTETAKQIAANYDCVMVDECQDNNRVQDIIFRMLTDGTDHLFMVGDIKQSIYRFRHAKPELFSKRLLTYASIENMKEHEPVRIVLKDNFRSRGSVIDTVNYLFGRVMSSKVGGVCYNADAAMNAGRSYPPLPPQFSDAAELHILDNEGETKVSKGAIDQEEYIAQMIQRMIEQKYQVTDSDTGQLRDCCYRDFMVLMRSHTRLGLMLKALDAHHIHYHTASVKAFYETSEIQGCLAMMKIAKNPQDDFNLWCFLLSPYALFDFDDAAALRLTANENGCQYMFDALKIAAEDEQNAIHAKAFAVVQLIGELRTQSMQMTVSDFLQYAFDRSHYLALLAAGEDGEQKNANLNLLCKEVAGWEQDNLGGIDGFLQYVSRLMELDEDIAPATALEQNDDVVEVMTIHGSKGLEAPICILCHCEARFNKMDTTGGYLLDADLGLTLQYSDEQNCIRYYNAYGEQLKSKIDAANTSEEMRLLYVALTRAREKLICVGSCQNLESRLKTLSKKAVSEEGDYRLLESWSGTVSNYMDWLLAGLLSVPEAALKLESMGYPVLNSLPFTSVLSHLGDSQNRALSLQVVIERASSYHPKLPPVKVENTELEPQSVSMEQVNRLLEPYPYQAVTKFPAKTSVTALSHQNPPVGMDLYHRQHEEQLLLPEVPLQPDILAEAGLKKPAFLTDEEESITGAMRGTATHAFLQYANFQAARDDLEQECVRLQQLAFLSETDLQLINRYHIKRFLYGKLCSRMLAAQKQGNLLREYAFIHELPATELDENLAENCRDEKIVVQGIADCIILDTDGLVLIDYKTDRLETEREFVERYQKQLSIYRDALNLLFSAYYPGKQAVKQMLIYSLYLGQEIEIAEEKDL